MGRCEPTARAAAEGNCFREPSPLKAQDAPPQNNNPLKTTTPSKQIFIGNFEYEAQERDIVRLFERYGPVEKIDMKSGEWWWACWL